MEALNSSDELNGRGAELRARSVPMRPEASEKRQKSTRPIASRPRPGQSAGIPGGTASVDPGPGEPAGEAGVEDLEAKPPTSETLVRMSQEARARALAARERARRGLSEQEMLESSALARLHARLQTLPMIEQAKGIIMGQQLCGPDEAFALLRRASQLANVKVNVMAAQLVEQVSASSRDDKAVPVSPRQAAQRPGVPVRGGASVHEHAAAVHDQAALMHEGAAAFFNEHDRADKAKRERSLAEDERAKAAEAREADDRRQGLAADRSVPR